MEWIVFVINNDKDDDVIMNSMADDQQTHCVDDIQLLATKKCNIGWRYWLAILHPYPPLAINLFAGFFTSKTCSVSLSRKQHCSVPPGAHYYHRVTVPVDSLSVPIERHDDHDERDRLHRRPPLCLALSKRVHFLILLAKFFVGLKSSSFAPSEKLHNSCDCLLCPVATTLMIMTYDSIVCQWFSL